jgi:hypothetical protein
LDNAVTNGTCTFEYWLFRDSEKSSLSVYFQSGDNHEKDVGLSIANETGNIRYSRNGNWVDSNCHVPTQKWYKLTIQLDCDQQVYSAYAGNENSVVLCENVAYSKPKARYVSQPGVNVPIPVPAYRVFDQLAFMPEGQIGTVTYIDDVSVKWVPTLHYAEPGKQLCFADDFEQHAADARIHDKKAGAGGKWEVLSSDSNSCFVDNDTSFGEGIKCLHAAGGADIIAELDNDSCSTLSDFVTLDFDIFVRSDKKFPYMIPDPTTKSKHRVTVALGNSEEIPLFGVHAGDGKWQYWDGTTYVESDVRINYDVWNHVQIALDMSTQSCRIVVQPLGELPTLVATAEYEPKANTYGRHRLRISTSNTPGHLSCYDNILVTCDETEE